ncbi:MULTISPECIES: GNAT family N-acetyltransferase [unclassified Microbacterium]|uniref:GNAT family N-acetyltransferase n=1 Tax=unclassified Microbacterium TaxID=2609290 RepID=UPI003869C151
MTPLTIRRDDLTGRDTLELIEHHLAGMRGQTPPESVHALGAAELRSPGVTVWSAWSGERIAGVAAWRRFGDSDAEIKSMRVADRFLGTGVGRALLRHLLAEALSTEVTRLWLETGSGDDFRAARGLYASEGFTECAPFGDYRADPLSTFMTRAV